MPAPADAAAGRAWHRPVARAVAVVVAALALAVGVALAVAAWSGATAPNPLVDPGAVVRFGLPAVRSVADLAEALTVGTLVLAAVALPVARRVRAAPGASGVPALAHAPALRLASAAAAVWALATLVQIVLGYADASGQPLDSPDFGGQVAAFVRQIDLGRGLLVVLLVALAVNLAAAVATTVRAAGLLSLLSLVALVPPALAGHSASAQGSHETAVTSLGLHLVGVCVWVGGLAGLVLLRRGLDDAALGRAAARFSRLAVVAVVLVGSSGAVNAWIRVGDLAGLSTRYGTLVVGKTLALALLGFLGWLHRRRTLPDLAAGDRAAFTRLAAVEAAVMAATVGLAVALGRSAPPVPQSAVVPPTPAQSLTGYPLPPAPAATTWLTAWQPDLLWVVLVGLGLAGYLGGVLRLHRRGDRWPAGRAICWLVGLAIVTWVTCGAPAVYGRVLFSAHMVGHMVISMAAPMFLVLGAPVTLALRALRPRSDGSRGAREWVVAVVESRYLRVLCHPVVVPVIFAGSLVFFYYSRLFPLALRTHVGHELMHVHFLFAGYLLAWLMVGIDPGPARPAPPLRLLILFITMAFHAFFGIALIQGTGVLASSYFAGLGRTWGASLLADQQYGGGLAWGIGEFPTLVLALVLAIQWTRTDDREARRRDRAADRDGDAELVAYNQMLARLAERDAPRR